MFVARAQRDKMINVYSKILLLIQSYFVPEIALGVNINHLLVLFDENNSEEQVCEELFFLFLSNKHLPEQYVYQHQ